jgi:hypothetical protein
MAIAALCEIVSLVDQSPAQVQPHAEHRATRIDEGGAKIEVRAEQIL